MLSNFIRDARSYYQYKHGENSLDYPHNDPLVEYGTNLVKATMEDIFESAESEYGLNLSKMEILDAFLYPPQNRGRCLYRSRNKNKGRTKFRQPKRGKHKKKTHKAKRKHPKDYKNCSWRRSMPKWERKMRAKMHRKWAKTNIELLREKGIDNFSKNDDKEYKRVHESWWW